MDVFEAIAERRSVREFLPRSPPEEIIRRVVSAAIMAPSAVNRQPWTFTVIRDRSLLDDISREAKAYMLAAKPLSLPEHLYERLTSADFHVFYQAPALIVISAPSADPWIAEDCALAAQNLMLAAHGLGLGSCWIGLSQPWLATATGKRALELPEAQTPMAPVILGYPAGAVPAVSRNEPVIRWVG